jgi:hypothetical protein
MQLTNRISQIREKWSRDSRQGRASVAQAFQLDFKKRRKQDGSED